MSIEEHGINTTPAPAVQPLERLWRQYARQSYPWFCPPRWKKRHNFYQGAGCLLVLLYDNGNIDSGKGIDADIGGKKYEGFIALFQEISLAQDEPPPGFWASLRARLWSRPL